MKSRIVILFCFICFLWSALIFRAGYLQFMPNENIQKLQGKQFTSQVTLNSRRGAIVDRNGRDLALSTAVYSLYADPKIIENKKQAAKKIAKVVSLSYESIYAKIKDPKKRFVWIERNLTEEKQDQIKAFKIRGLSFVQEWKRIYPNENLMSQILGFLGSEQQPLDGLELSLDKILRGNSKKFEVKRDARGRPLMLDGLLFTESPEGAEVKLTVDYELQYMMEAELKRAVTEHEADSAVGIILDAETSAIRAMASLPSYDANQAQKVSQDFRRNRAVSDTFEPGSTIKTFLIAGALKEGIAAPNTKYNCEDGKFKVGDRIIREADSNHKWKMLTVSEILAHSSNVGTTKISFQLGSEKVRQIMLDFGFGKKSEIDLPGEAKGILHPTPWRQHLLANISFGHGMSATALQVANAYAAIANGGVLRTPYMVDSWYDQESGMMKTTQPQEIRRVLTQQQSDAMKMMLTGVTDKAATGYNARVDGYQVAGKTGTAQKVNPTGRGYLSNSYLSSFAGFIPAHDPKFVIYIVVDNPKKGYYGSQVAAPVFSRIASYAVRKEGISPVIISEKNLIKKNPQNDAIKKIRELAQAEETEKANETLTTVPDLTNLTARAVLKRIKGSDIIIKMKGQGTVSEMDPAPGSEMPANKKVTVILR